MNVLVDNVLQDLAMDGDAGSPLPQGLESAINSYYAAQKKLIQPKFQTQEDGIEDPDDDESFGIIHHQKVDFSFCNFVWKLLRQRPEVGVGVWEEDSAKKKGKGRASAPRQSGAKASIRNTAASIPGDEQLRRIEGDTWRKLSLRELIDQHKPKQVRLVCSTDFIRFVQAAGRGHEIKQESIWLYLQLIARGRSNGVNSSDLMHRLNVAGTASFYMLKWLVDLNLVTKFTAKETQSSSTHVVLNRFRDECPLYQGRIRARRPNEAAFHPAVKDTEQDHLFQPEELNVKENAATQDITDTKSMTIEQVFARLGTERQPHRVEELLLPRAARRPGNRLVKSTQRNADGSEFPSDALETGTNALSQTEWQVEEEHRHADTTPNVEEDGLDPDDDDNQDEAGDDDSEEDEVQDTTADQFDTNEDFIESKTIKRKKYYKVSFWTFSPLPDNIYDQLGKYRQEDLIFRALTLLSLAPEGLAKYDLTTRMGLGQENSKSVQKKRTRDMWRLWTVHGFTESVVYSYRRTAKNRATRPSDAALDFSLTGKALSPKIYCNAWRITNKGRQHLKMLREKLRPLQADFQRQLDSVSRSALCHENTYDRLVADLIGAAGTDGMFKSTICEALSANRTYGRHQFDRFESYVDASEPSLLIDQAIVSLMDRHSETHEPTLRLFTLKTILQRSALEASKLTTRVLTTADIDSQNGQRAGVGVGGWLRLPGEEMWDKSIKQAWTVLSVEDLDSAGRLERRKRKFGDVRDDLEGLEKGSHTAGSKGRPAKPYVPIGRPRKRPLTIAPATTSPAQPDASQTLQPMAPASDGDVTEPPAQRAPAPDLILDSAPDPAIEDITDEVRVQTSTELQPSKRIRLEASEQTASGEASPSPDKEAVEEQAPSPSSPGEASKRSTQLTLWEMRREAAIIDFLKQDGKGYVRDDRFRTYFDRYLIANRKANTKELRPILNNREGRHDLVRRSENLDMLHTSINDPQTNRPRDIAIIYLKSLTAADLKEAVQKIQESGESRYKEPAGAYAGSLAAVKQSVVGAEEAVVARQRLSRMTPSILKQGERVSGSDSARASRKKRSKLVKAGELSARQEIRRQAKVARTARKQTWDMTWSRMISNHEFTDHQMRWLESSVATAYYKFINSIPTARHMNIEQLIKKRIQHVLSVDETTLIIPPKQEKRRKRSDGDFEAKRKVSTPKKSSAEGARSDTPGGTGNLVGNDMNFYSRLYAGEIAPPEQEGGIGGKRRRRRRPARQFDADELTRDVGVILTCRDKERENSRSNWAALRQLGIDSMMVFKKRWQHLKSFPAEDAYLRKLELAWMTLWRKDRGTEQLEDHDPAHPTDFGLRAHLEYLRKHIDKNRVTSMTLQQEESLLTSESPLDEWVDEFPDASDPLQDLFVSEFQCVQSNRLKTFLSHNFTIGERAKSNGQTDALQNGLAQTVIKIDDRLQAESGWEIGAGAEGEEVGPLLHLLSMDAVDFQLDYDELKANEAELVITELNARDIVDADVTVTAWAESQTAPSSEGIVHLDWDELTPGWTRWLGADASDLAKREASILRSAEALREIVSSVLQLVKDAGPSGLALAEIKTRSYPPESAMGALRMLLSGKRPAVFTAGYDLTRLVSAQFAESWAVPSPKVQETTPGQAKVTSHGFFAPRIWHNHFGAVMEEKRKRCFEVVLAECKNRPGNTLAQLVALFDPAMSRLDVVELLMLMSRVHLVELRCGEWRQEEAFLSAYNDEDLTIVPTNKIWYTAEVDEGRS
ncbi:hypothetical protein OC861_004896 [Tilletia horrida]|nr:hypothetical protein OC861_004896 [Tilletia horrida]